MLRSGQGVFKVLIIDDLPAMQELLSSMLERYELGSCQITSCASLVEAFEIFEHEYQDVIIADLFLAETSELGTLRALKDFLPEVPIVVITGHDREGLALECFELGASDYLTKPHITPALLYKSCLYSIESKRLEGRRKLLVKVLKLLNSTYTGKETIERLLSLLKETLDVEAIAIRLKEGNDYPFFVYQGFDSNFIESENYLCKDVACEGSGRGGDDELECVCGCVIRGKPNLGLPFFTAHGSFWANSISDLSESKYVGLLKNHRDTCRLEGYESIAIIPLTSGEGIIGTLQINDKRKNIFSLSLIELLEEVAITIAVAVQRAWQEDKIRDLEIAKTKDLLQSSRLLNSGIAHELRTPMQALLNCLELIKEEVHGVCNSQECRNQECLFSDKICGAQESILGLVMDGLDRIEYSIKVLNSLSEYSKIASGDKHDLINIVPELKTITRTLRFTDMFKAMDHESCGVEMMGGQTEDCFVKMNRVDFSQLITNLCRNAREAIHHDSPKIRILLSYSFSNAVIRVVDNGKGINPDLGDKIFTPYFSTKENPDNYNQGLGLAMVRDIVAAYGGTISYNSRPGRTEFIITLPCQHR